MSQSLNSINAIEIYNQQKNNPHEEKRNKSWEYCHNIFSKYTGKQIDDQTKELLALHLTGFLASWGMYCRKSPLLHDCSYMVHMGLVKILLDKKYSPLFKIDDEKGFASNIGLIEKMYDEINSYYAEIHPNSPVSATLVTKVMLGVFGCIPAYDTNVNKALAYCGIQHTGKHVNMFNSLLNALNENKDFCNRVKEIQSQKSDYTFMRVVDMVLWKSGSLLNERSMANES